MQQKKIKLSSNEQAVTGALKVFVAFIIIGVVTYSEILFLGIISVIFPEGALRIGAIVGAVATGASVLVLYAGKAHWFTPGAQFLAAVIFTGCEVAVLVMNDMLAFNLHNGHLDSYLSMWYQVTPASPVLALVGWGIVLYLDTAQRERHKDMEMEAEKARSEREYQLAAHEAHMELRASHLRQVVARLDDALSAPSVQAKIAQHADRMVAKVLTDVSGINAFTPQIQASKTIESSIEPVQLAQEASLSSPPKAEEQKIDSSASSNVIERLFNGLIESSPFTTAPLDNQAEQGSKNGHQQ